MMETFGIANYPAFLVAGILLNLTPGADTIYILARSISQGKGAGILSALGISTGALLHTLAASCGLSVILASSATLFQLIKYAGALYLVYLGIQAFRAGSVAKVEGGPRGREYSNREIYFSGVLTNVLNPKVALFFLAFLPQFIITGYHNPAISFVILGITFITTGTIWCLFLAFFASSLTGKITGRAGFSRVLHKITGVLFIGLGITLAFTKR
jgi:threonine/homoserine/homoserine lactone efflux protein